MNIQKRNMWEILIPAYDPKGMKIPLSEHRDWDEKIRAISGGLTIEPISRGQYVDTNGKIIFDSMIPVRFLATDDEAEEIVNFTLKFYSHQESVLAYKISTRHILQYRS